MASAQRGCCPWLSREAEPRASSQALCGGSAGSWRHVRQGGRPAGQDAHGAQSLHPPLPSDLWRVYGRNRNGGRSRCWRSRFLGLRGQGVETKKQASCRAVACSGFLGTSQAESPASYPMPKPGLVRGLRRGYWTELHVLDPHVRAGDRGGRSMPRVSGVLQAQDF